MHDVSSAASAVAYAYRSIAHGWTLQQLSDSVR